jgi:hypothetical protein
LAGLSSFARATDENAKINSITAYKIDLVVFMVLLS